MKLCNIVPLGRPQSGSVIGCQKYYTCLESKAMRLFGRLKIACHNADILKMYNQQ